MEDLITTPPTAEPSAAPDFDFDFFNPPNLEACLAVETFLTTALLRRLTQLLTYNDEQLAQAVQHVMAIESLLGIA